jgi:hypothetical protein
MPPQPTGDGEIAPDVAVASRASKNKRPAALPRRPPRLDQAKEAKAASAAAIVASTSLSVCAAETNSASN